MQLNQKQQRVADYYARLESRLGYWLLLGRSQHFGYYDDQHTTEPAAQQNFHERLLELLGVRPGMQLLDAGCGQGVVAAFVAKHSGAHVTGVTITPHEVRSARRIAKKQGAADGTTFVLADYSELPFPDASFDRIYAIETLCHAVDIARVIREFARVLKPGGKVVLVEYEFDLAAFGDEEREALALVKAVGGIFGLEQMGLRKFPEYLQRAGLHLTGEDDWTPGITPSVNRLERLLGPLCWFVRRFHLEKYMVNAVAARMYGEIIRRHEFSYKVFVAGKPAAKLAEKRVDEAPGALVAAR